MSEPEEAVATGQKTAGQAEPQQQQPQQPATTPAAGNEQQPLDQSDWTQEVNAENKPAANPLADALPEAPEKAGEQTDAAQEGGEEAEAEVPLEVAFPDGFQVDEAEMNEFQAIAKEFKVPQEQAQKLADIYVAGQKKQMDLFRSEHANQLRRIDQKWREEIAADPDVGGENYETSKTYAIAAIRRFVPQEEQAAFLEFYRAANLHNNPHMFRLLARVGKGTGEAAPAIGDKGGDAAEKSRADVMNPELPSGRV